MKRIVDSRFIPYFKDGDYQTGIEQGTIETIKAVTGQYPSAESGVLSSAKRKLRYWWGVLGLWMFAIFGPILAVLMVGVRYLWRMRSRSCQQCGTKMTMMDEHSDDEHIDGGQRLEEYLKSVDYDVWQCHNCMHIDLFRYVSFFTPYQLSLIHI